MNPEHEQFSIGRPGTWTVVLKGGPEITIHADSYGETAGVVVFNVLADGEPPRLVEIACIPATAIDTISGGP